MYVTRQINGSGSAYRILPQTTMKAASGLTAISAQSGWITVRNGDVLTCYVDGLAGDTSTPDWTTRWYELAGVTAAAVADAVLDEATSGHTSAGSFSKAVTDILADTGTDGVKIASAQTVATVTNLTNLPTIPANWITAAGVATGAIDADAIASNAITSAKIATGAITNAKFASGAIDAAAIATDAIGSAEISAAAVTKIQSGLALEATLTAIKGAGWTDETLVKIVSDIAAISAGGATAQEVWEYATRTLTSGSGLTAAEVWQYATRQLTGNDNIFDLDYWNTLGMMYPDLTPLAKTTHLQEVEDKIDAVKAKTDLIPASPAEAGEYTAAIAAVKSVADDILVDTGTTLDALIKDIPTNAELATALGTADDAVLAAVAAAKTVIDNIHDTDLPAVKAETALIVGIQALPSLLRWLRLLAIQTVSLAMSGHMLQGH